MRSPRTSRLSRSAPIRCRWRFRRRHPVCSREIVKAANQPVAPGEVLGRIEVGAATAAIAAPQRDSSATARGTGSIAQELSPAVARLIREHNLDPKLIRGTGRGGRVTYDDVLEFVANQQTCFNIAEPHGSAYADAPQHCQSHAAQRAVGAACHGGVRSRYVARAGPSRRLSRQAEQRIAEHHRLFDSAPRCRRFTPFRRSTAGGTTMRSRSSTIANIGIGTAIEGGGLIVPVIHKAQNLDLARNCEPAARADEKARSGALNSSGCARTEHSRFRITA